MEKVTLQGFRQYGKQKEKNVPNAAHLIAAETLQRLKVTTVAVEQALKDEDLGKEGGTGEQGDV